MTERIIGTHSRRRRMAVALAVIAAVVAVGFIAYSSRNASLSMLSRVIDESAIYLTVWRFFFYLVVIAFWSRGITWLARKKNWSAEMTCDWIAYRWRAAIWLAVYELLFAQNIVGRILLFF